MNVKSLISDKTCYIVSKELKKAILSYVSEEKLLLDIHFFSLQQLIDKIYFSYDNSAIYSVSIKFQLSYENAKIIIENLKYLMYSKDIADEKLEYLRKIKKHLDDNNLLIYDEKFIDFIKRYNLISDLSQDNEFLFKINELLDNQINFVKLEENNDFNVYEFNDSNDEIEYVANSIANLIDNHIDPNNIHILNYSQDYLALIDKIFSSYNIPYNIDNNLLYDIGFIKTLYKKYIGGDNLVDYNDNLSIVFKEIIESISFIENKEDKDNYLLYLLKTTTNSKNIYKNCINFSSYETVYLDNHYYYFIGLNNKAFPLYKKDEDYISDALKKKLGYITSYESNALKKEYCINRLKSNANIFLSFKNKDYFNSYLRSDLISLSNFNVIKGNIENQYSKQYDYLKLTRELDDFYKYDKKSNLLIELLSKLDKSQYKTYDNSYINVDKKLYFENILNNNLSISYSSFERFNQCKYKYYLNSILKENEETFITYLGTLFHYVLEKIYEENFDFYQTVNEYKSTYSLNEKEIVLLNNLLGDFEDKIKLILEQYKRGNFKNIKKEQRITIRNKSDISINIIGFIDKIMLDNENNAYIVDYKTGETKLTLEYLEYGLKCQLPFYFYLLNKSNEFANIYLVGCYLQIINFKIKNYKDNTKELLLEGLTLNDENIISKIDNFYNVDSFIKGIKPNSNGLGTYARLFNSEDFIQIVGAIEKNIELMIDDIKNVNFSINPKIISKRETTCQYCNYKDICYRNFNNYIDVRKVTNNEMD